MIKDKSKKVVDKWIKRIDAERKKHKEFRRNAKKAIEVYENKPEKSFDEDSKYIDFPVLRSVVDVQLGSLTSKMPKAKISKRFEYQGQSKLCSKIEKAINYFIERSNMQNEVFQSAEDYLTAGLGGMRVLYDAEIGVIQQEIVIDELVEIEEIEKVISEKLEFERFEWCNFGWQPCKRWNDCDWIYFKSTFTLSEFKEKYKLQPSSIEMQNEDKQDVKVYEIWDKEKGYRFEISDSHNEVLEVDENPLKTDYFYPCAEPMFFALKDDDLTPSPEFYFWQKLHDKVQELTSRETSLIESIKDVEFYEKGAFSDLSKLQGARDGKKVPIDLSKYTNANTQPNINNAISAKDNSSALRVLQTVVERRDDCLSKIYQITGIGDIMQATSDPNETATAQNLKHSWGSARLASKRFCIENHIRATIEIATNTLVKLFEPQSIQQAAGEKLTPEDVQELQNTNEYRIDVETLSTLSIDKDRDQQNNIELMNAISALFQQSQLIPQPLTLALLENVTKTFVSGDELQETIEQLPQYFNELQQAQQQVQKAQQEVQNIQMQIQEVTAQNQAMAQELNKFNEAKVAKDHAEVMKKQAEIRKIEVETAQKANESIVDPLAIVDEQVAIGQEQLPVQLQNGTL